MQYQLNKYTAAMAAVVSLSVYAGEAAAAVSFNSSANVNFSVVSVTGGTDLSSLEMSGSFMRSGEDFPVVYTDTSGDANVTDNNPEIPLISSTVIIGQPFTHAFNMSGSVTDGSISFDQVAWYDLEIANHGAESFDIIVDFSYDLSTQIQGHDGGTDVVIEYWDWDDPDTSYGDLIGATTVLPNESSGHSANNMQFTFTLGAFEGKSFGIDIQHAGNLEAAPVPLPAAVWPFLTGLLGIVGLRKRKV